MHSLLSAFHISPLCLFCFPSILFLSHCSVYLSICLSIYISNFLYSHWNSLQRVAWQNHPPAFPVWALFLTIHNPSSACSLSLSSTHSCYRSTSPFGHCCTPCFTTLLSTTSLSLPIHRLHTTGLKVSCQTLHPMGIIFSLCCCIGMF